MANYRMDQRGNMVRVDRSTGKLEAQVSSQTRRAVVGMRLNGLDDLVGAFEALSMKIKPILRQAAKRSATPIVQHARNLLPVRGKRTLQNGKRVFTYGLTGQLRKSISSRILTSRTGRIHAVIGPRRDSVTMAFKAYHKPTKAAKAQKNVMVRVKPSNYAHLVEKGFIAKLWGTGRTKEVAARGGTGFLAPALSANQTMVESITRKVLEEQLMLAQDKRQALLEAL